jgi:hypothetical protein
MDNGRVYTGTALNQRSGLVHENDRVNLLYFISGGQVVQEKDWLF